MDPNLLIKEIKPRPYLEERQYDFDLRLESLMRIARTMCPKFELTDQSREIYENVIKYFAADQGCPYDLAKGLYIYGNIGVGKTLLFKIFKALNKAVDSPNNFKMLSVTDLVDGISRDGYQYFLNSGISTERLSWRGGPEHILIDDMGQSARIANYYGNSIDVVTEFIQRRYYSYTDQFVLTHISTNLVPTKIEAEFGKAINSRMREMFNIILFPGRDQRH